MSKSVNESHGSLRLRNLQALVASRQPGAERMITALSTAARVAKTRHQIELVEVPLTWEFSILPAGVVHGEVVRVSDRLLAEARFTDHIAVPTGRFAAERMRGLAASQPEGAFA
jgi:hypothetical protein